MYEWPLQHCLETKQRQASSLNWLVNHEGNLVPLLIQWMLNAARYQTYPLDAEQCPCSTDFNGYPPVCPVSCYICKLAAVSKALYD